MSKKNTSPEQRLAKQIAYNNCELLRQILEANSEIIRKFNFPLVYLFFISNFLEKRQF